MMRRTSRKVKEISFLLLLMVVALASCSPLTFETSQLFSATSTPAPTGAANLSPRPTNTPLPSQTPVPTSTEMPAPTATSEPTSAPSDTPEPTATSTPTDLPATATPETMVRVGQVEPTLTPSPGDERARVGELPLGQPGHYVNVTFGYWAQVPAEWYTGFGNRPLLVSFSNLDPGTHNRSSMRAGGCLVEISAATNLYGFALEDLASQMPRALGNAEQFELDGQTALKVRRSSEENPFESEEVYVEHDDRLLLINFDYAREASDVCRPAWENLLARWQWFTPQFAAYRNTEMGYSVSHPRSWYRFNAEARGVSISSNDPTGATDLGEIIQEGMLIETTVYDNQEGLSLKEWLVSQDLDPDLTNDIPLEGIVGVRMRREGPIPGSEETSGYFQGPLGKIYGVTCLYPTDRQNGFRPIANAVIYSFEF